MAGQSDDALRIADDEPHRVQERVGLVQGVAVDRAHVAVARVVEAAVAGVRLRSLVLFLDDAHVPVASAAKGAANGRRVDDATLELRERLEVEHAVEDVEGAVRRSVLDDDQLELGIVEPECRRDRHRGDVFFVEDRDDHAHGDRETRVGEHLEVLDERLAAPDRVVERREDDQVRVEREHAQHVREADQRRDVDRVLEQGTRAPAFRAVRGAARRRA